MFSVFARLTSRIFYQLDIQPEYYISLDGSNFSQPSPDYETIPVFVTALAALHYSGLGLSLTYDMVVKGHGGRIQVNSVEGEGSEFIITLPIN